MLGLRCCCEVVVEVIVIIEDVDDVDDVDDAAKGVVVVATTGEGTSCGDGEGDDQSFGFLRIPGRLSGAGLEG